MMYAGEPVYDDYNYRQLIGDGTKVMVCGEMRYLTAMPRTRPYGSLAGCRAFGADFQTIPRHEWSARIKDMEKYKSRLSDLITWKAKDQNGTNYCWMFGVVGALETQRKVQGVPYVELSPASAAGPITGYQNVGGWGGDALEYLSQHGCCNAKLWPTCAINRNLMNDAVREDYKNHKVLEYWEGEDRNFDQIMTLAFMRFASPLGLDWWRHLVFGCDPVEIEPGRFGLRIRNSHSDNNGAKNDHGVGGFMVLAEEKARGDFFGIRQVTSAKE